MIIDAIEAALARAKKEGWEKTYWVFDLHNTIVTPTFGKSEGEEFYPFALESLKILGSREDVCLILFTSSRQQKLEAVLNKFKGEGIEFSYINENPEVRSNDYANFDKKFYFNVMFEDKAGFHPLKDWEPVYKYLREPWDSTDTSEQSENQHNDGQHQQYVNEVSSNAKAESTNPG